MTVVIDPNFPEWVSRKWFCHTQHPDQPGVYCTRLAGHPPDHHSAFVFSIAAPQSWPV